jgi:hypothetical protein
MVTISWSPHGFYIAVLLPYRANFNMGYFFDNIMALLQSMIFPAGRKKENRKLSLHFANCFIHRSKESQGCFERNQIKKIPQPPYSPDIPPGEFHMFGMLKRKLEGTMILDEHELMDDFDDIQTTVKTDELINVFDLLIERVPRLHRQLNFFFRCCFYDNRPYESRAKTHAPRSTEPKFLATMIRNRRQTRLEPSHSHRPNENSRGR